MIRKTMIFIAISFFCIFSISIVNNEDIFEDPKIPEEGVSLGLQMLRVKKEEQKEKAKNKHYGFGNRAIVVRSRSFKADEYLKDLIKRDEISSIEELKNDSKKIIIKRDFLDEFKKAVERIDGLSFEGEIGVALSSFWDNDEYNSYSNNNSNYKGRGNKYGGANINTHLRKFTTENNKKEDFDDENYSTEEHKGNSKGKTDGLTIRDEIKRIEKEIERLQRKEEALLKKSDFTKQEDLSKYTKTTKSSIDSFITQDGKTQIFVDVENNFYDKTDNDTDPSPDNNRDYEDKNESDNTNTNSNSNNPDSELEIDEDIIPWGVRMVYNDPTLSIYNPPFGGDGIVVAVLDTGIKASHPDLKNRIRKQYDMFKEGDVFSSRNEGSADDKDGHGTHVAGTIAADASNHEGVYGVAPGVMLDIYKVLDDDGAGGYDVIEKALDHACSQEDVKIISMSLGGKDPGYSSFYETIDECWNKGKLLIAASGNDGYVSYISFPASHDKVIAVGAVKSYNHDSLDCSESTLAKAWFSNYDLKADLITNSNHKSDSEKEEVMNYNVELAFPGVEVYSTYIDADSYEHLQGTSMATPLASGTAAKIWSQNPELTNVEMRKILRNKNNCNIGQLNDSGYSAETGFGFSRLN